MLLGSLAEVTDSRDWRLRRELGDEAVALADGLDDSAKLDVILSCYQFRAQPERSVERLAETAWACRRRRLLGDPVLGHLARFQRIHACMEVGDLPEVDRRIEEMGPLVERSGLPFCRWQRSSPGPGERSSPETWRPANGSTTRPWQSPAILGRRRRSESGGQCCSTSTCKGRVEERSTPSPRPRLRTRPSLFYESHWRRGTHLWDAGRSGHACRADVSNGFWGDAP